MAVFRQARRIPAGILEVFQGNGTQHDGKPARIQPPSGGVNTPLIERVAPQRGATAKILFRESAAKKAVPRSLSRWSLYDEWEGSRGRFFH